MRTFLLTAFIFICMAMVNPAKRSQTIVSHEISDIALGSPPVSNTYARFNFSAALEQTYVFIYRIHYINGVGGETWSDYFYVQIPQGSTYYYNYSKPPIYYYPAGDYDEVAFAPYFNYKATPALYNSVAEMNDTSFKFNQKVTIMGKKLGIDDWVDHTDTIKYKGTLLNVKLASGIMDIQTIGKFDIKESWRSKFSTKWLNWNVAEQKPRQGSSDYIRCMLREDFFIMEWPQKRGPDRKMQQKFVVLNVVQKQGGSSDRRYFKS